jgi:UDP-N-acetylmuramyl pentapeptide phosphotransferase/UDP-N-acetylglucosamine-1-phosphate transferase
MFPLWFPLLLFSPFIVDATVTLVRRGLRGEKVWQAHREHFYQRLVRAGWGHRKTVLVEYGLMLLVGASGLWLLQHQAWVFAVLTAWSIFYIGLMLLVERYTNRRRSV